MHENIKLHEILKINIGYYTMICIINMTKILFVLSEITKFSEYKYIKKIHFFGLKLSKTS